MKSEMVMQNCNNIPKHWQIKKLGEIVSVLGDGLHGTPKYSDTGEYFFINGNNLFDGRIVIRENTKRVALKEYEKYKKQLNDRTILVSINGTIGNIAFYNKEKVILGKSACYFNLLDSVDKKYIRLVLSGQGFINYALKAATGSTIKNVSLKSMREFEIPLPPLPEQQAIVAKIEELLSDLENGKQQLLTAQQQLKVYRQSLLKAAFEGKLTNKDVKDGELPKGWRYEKLGDVCEIKNGKNQKLVVNPNGKYPIYGSAGIMGYANSYLCEAGSTIVGRKGTINKPLYINSKFWNVDTAFGFVPNLKIISSRFLYFFCLSFNFSKLDKSTTIPSLAKTDLQKIDVKVPTLQEQQLIVDVLESKLTVCDKIEETITQSLQQAEMLKQSILKRAFEGKLV